MKLAILHNHSVVGNELCGKFHNSARIIWILKMEFYKWRKYSFSCNCNNAMELLCVLCIYLANENNRKTHGKLKTKTKNKFRKNRICKNCNNNDENWNVINLHMQTNRKHSYKNHLIFMEINRRKMNDKQHHRKCRKMRENCWWCA